MRMLKRFLLILLIVCGHGGVGVWAATPANTIRMSPSLSFEMFNRSKPERLGIVRVSGGLTVEFPLPSAVSFEDRLSAEAGAWYGSENDTFATGNFFDENIYRARLGTLTKLWQNNAFRLTLAVGGQFSVHSQSYTLAGTKNAETDTVRFWAPYGGFQFDVIPVAGFGVQESLLIHYDAFLNAWIPQFVFALSF